MGYGPVLLNIAGLFAVFLAVATVLIAIDRFVARSSHGEAGGRG